MPNKTPNNLIFYFYAALLILTALYHVNKFFIPSANESATRHLIFVGIYTICVFGLIKRPKWFIYFFGVFALFQLYSHGANLLQYWRLLHTINYIDLAIVVMMPVIFISLLRNQHAAS